MTSGLLTAGSGHPWETELVGALDRPGAPYTVVQRCADLADVLAMAATGQVSAVVLSSDLRRLDSEAVRRLQGLGVAVVAVHPAGDPRAPVRLGRIGIADTVPDDAGSSAILGVLAGAISASTGADPGGEPGERPAAASREGWPVPSTSEEPRYGPAAEQLDGTGDGAGADRVSWLRRRARPMRDPVVSDPASALQPGPRGPVSADRTDLAGASGGEGQHPGHPAPAPFGPDAGRRGVVVAVWGPTGAPGRSTVAMGIADEAAAAGSTVLLIDADVYGGVLAAAFGLLDESPGLAGACRMASNGRLDTAALTGLCWSLGPRWSMLTGIARADRWPEVRPSAIPMVLALARGLADLVVIDCAAILETDEEISFDTMAPRRNGATLAVLAEADIVLAVGSGDPPGIERLVRGLAHLVEAVPEASPRIVVNRVRRTAASRHEIAEALARFAGVEVLAYLPEDREATDRAWHRCVGLSVAAPRSTLRSRLAALARTVVPSAPGGTDRVAEPPDLEGPADAGPEDASRVAVGDRAVAGRSADERAERTERPGRSGRRGRRGRHAGADG